MAEKIWVVLCGGPGKFHPKDKEEHDRGWSNYVDHLLLMAHDKKLPTVGHEKLWWVIYKPAYDARWADDVARSAKSVADLKKKGFSSYTDMLTKRAASYGFRLFWLGAANDFYSILRKAPVGSITRVWYYGHARDDLWLTLDHDPKGEAVQPSASGTVLRFGGISGQVKSIKNAFAVSGSKYDAKRSHRFYACNSRRFAIEWATALKVFTEGAVGTVRFQTVHKIGAPDTSSACTWHKYSPKGKVVS